MFEKRYLEYVQENHGIVRHYRERGLLLEVDTGEGQEQALKELCRTLEKDKRWMNTVLE